MTGRRVRPLLRWMVLLLVLGLVTVAAACGWIYARGVSPYHIGTEVRVGTVWLNYVQSYQQNSFGRVQIFSKDGSDLRLISADAFRKAADEQVAVGHPPHRFVDIET